MSVGRVIRQLTAIAFLVTVIASTGCGDDDDEAATGSRTPTPFCTTDAVAASEVDIEQPRFGGTYTRHVPVEGWVDVAPGRLLRADIKGPRGGKLASSEIEVGKETRGDLHRIEASIVLQSLPEKQDACLELRVQDSTVRLPITIGGANP
jgi:hypothetical protein